MADQPAAAATARIEPYVRPLFVATIVTGSFLLFLTQPMIARMALPRLGGAPAVWNSAMLVYQALLLGGYAYAHALTRLGPRRQAGVHLALFAVAALWLPIGLTAAVPPAAAEPALWAPWFLVSSIGPLFFVISAQAPLMQRWYALETGRREPYALYAASNLGSFAGLIAYPLLVEPLLTLERQSLLWTGGYALLVALVAICALTIPRRAVEAAPVSATPAPPARRVVYWIVLAAVPSGLMLSTTTHLTTDIVALPLLWVLPLGLYLLSFVIAFSERRAIADFVTQVAPLIVLIAGGLAFATGSRTPIFSATLGLSLLFTIAVTLHAEMYRTRPAADRLTGFYLAMSVGGVLGGLFCAIVAPLVFDWAYEHPLLIVAAAFLIPQQPLIAPLRRLWADPLRRRALTVAVPLLALLLSLIAAHRMWFPTPEWADVGGSIAIALLAVACIGARFAYGLCLAALMLSYGGWSTVDGSFNNSRIRSYFGIYQFGSTGEGQVRTLTHGTTLHGTQYRALGLDREPTSYYGQRSGVGAALLAAEQLFGPNAGIGIVGLGTGTLACYAQPGQRWTFFEIDPAVVRIARDSGHFTFLSQCTPDARIVVGDARLTLARTPPASLDLIAVDAFSSDSVPMHLLTREALQVYARALKPGGLILIHISNRYLDLRPVLAANAAALGWAAAIRDHDPETLEEKLLQNTSVWVALSPGQTSLNQLIAINSMDGIGWDAMKPRPGFDGWTDDHATILPLLKNIMP